MFMTGLFSSAWRKGRKSCQIKHNKYVVNKQCQRFVYIGESTLIASLNMLFSGNNLAMQKCHDVWQGHEQCKSPEKIPVVLPQRVL